MSETTYAFSIRPGGTESGIAVVGHREVGFYEHMTPPEHSCPLHAAVIAEYVLNGTVGGTITVTVTPA